MGNLVGRFKEVSHAAIELARAGELARATSPPGSSIRKNLHYKRLEYLYESAYLRVFVAWEDFLAQTFYRYMCGHFCSIGQMLLATPTASYCGSIASAETTILGGHHYMLWHNPSTVIKRSKSYFRNGLHEIVINSDLSLLDACAHIRHRIAHGQDDARTKFDVATRQLAGRCYRGSRPGSFLRDTKSPALGHAKNWLERLSTDLCALAAQIAP